MIVDDEPDIVQLVSYNLQKEGYEVSSAADGSEALGKLRRGDVDFVLLDLMLPGIHGMELCRIMRSDPATRHIPIVMLTAKGEEVDRVLGLEMGADDYLAKPFGMRELLARMKAVLRRTAEAGKTDQIVRLGRLTINKETFSVSKGGDLLHLSSTEFKLLLFLAERRGKVFSRDQLLDAVWKGDAFVEPRTVDVHIRRLRTQIEDDPAQPRYLKTRRGLGYYVDVDL